MSAIGYFVAGTDTGVGKSLASSALLHKLVDQGMRAVGMKPVAAGTFEQHCAHTNEDVLQLQAAGNVAAPLALRCPYLLQAPLSPHLAAAAEGVTISLPRITGAYRELAAMADAVIVEGAGGFRVPLTQELDGADLAAALELPVILVVGMRLGCLNHALLTQDAIAARGLRLDGWIACRVDPGMDASDANVATLQRLMNAPMLGDIPHLQHADARRAAAFLDTSALLRPTEFPR